MLSFIYRNFSFSKILMRGDTHFICTWVSLKKACLYMFYYAIKYFHLSEIYLAPQWLVMCVKESTKILVLAQAGHLDIFIALCLMMSNKPIAQLIIRMVYDCGLIYQQIVICWQNTNANNTSSCHFFPM